MLKQKSFHTGHGTLNYMEGPASGYPILLLHGITDNWQTFASLMSTLVLKWHVFAVDFRGHGQSSRVPSQYRLKDYAEDITRFLESEFTEPPVIYGHSLGGMIGILIAAARRDLVRALVVGDSLLYRETITEFCTAQTNTGDRKILYASESTISGMSKRLIEAAPGLGGAQRRYMAKAYTLIDPDVIDLLTDVDEDYDCSILFPKIACPVLLLQSKAMTEEDAQRAMQQLVDGYLVNIDGGHMQHYGPKGYEVLNAVWLFLEGL